MKILSPYLKDILKRALAEDIGKGDITTNALIPASAHVKAHLVFKSGGVVCGLYIAQRIFKTFSKKVTFRLKVKEGSKVKKQTVVAVIEGPARVILTSERVAINFLTRLSSIATYTMAIVDSIKMYPSKIFDTRKTTPLLRPLERYAVRVGGGYNHRFNLSAMAMIKDNHRLLLGKTTLKDAVDIIKHKSKKRVVLEVDTLNELKDALTSKAEVILLDNMTPAQVQQAVWMRNKTNSRVLLEASGGINERNILSYAKTKVERISVGSLTAVGKAVDFSLDIIL